MDCEKDQRCQISFPPNVITTVYHWKMMIGDAIGDDESKRHIADTLMGCESLAWFIDRFNTDRAVRSVPAKMLLHQILDVLHEICILNTQVAKFKKAYESFCEVYNLDKDRHAVVDIYDDIRNRTHLSKIRRQQKRDLNYDYFNAINDSWVALCDVISNCGGDFSDYNGLLSTLSIRENARVTERQRRILDMFN